MTGTLRMLLRFLRPYAGQVALSVLLGVATIASVIGLLGTSAYLIASAALHPSVAALQVAIVGVRFFGISRAVLRYLERLVSHSVNFHLLAELRAWFYRMLEPLAPARLQNLRSADLLNRAVADIETLENFYVRAVAPPLVALVVICGVGVFVAQYSPRLAILLVGALLVAGVGVPLLVHLLARVPGRQVIERRTMLNANILDAVQGMPDLLAFGQADALLERVVGDGRALSSAQSRLGQAGSLGSALGLLVSGLALWGMLWLAIPLVGVRIDGVSLAVLALVTLAAFEAVAPLTQAAQHLEASLEAGRRLFALVDIEPEVAVPQQPLPVASDSLDLRIHRLCFTYPDSNSAARSTPALLDFDLDLLPGKHVALVGPSGAGKTSLFNLLLRFWEFDQGSILLNGCDLRGFAPDDLRARMAVIAQSTYLFSGTLRQNLLLGSPSASAQDLDRVLLQAQLAELVAQLPQGLDTWVGERGLNLSGGERQRVTVARALLRDAPLLLMDEPTANLDAANEQRLLEVLRLASAGRSVIHITHRLIGLEDMDEIIVLQHGRVVERGIHAGLLQAGGPYAQMWKIQAESLAE